MTEVANSLTASFSKWVCENHGLDSLAAVKVYQRLGLKLTSGIWDDSGGTQQ